MAPQVWLGDLLRAVAAGAPPRRAAELLGLVPEAAPAPAVAELVAAEQPQATPPLPPDPVAKPRAEPPPADEEPPPQAIPMLPESSTLPLRETDWSPLPSLRLPEDDQSPRPTPLLAPRTAAAVLHAVLATFAADGDPDVEAITRSWAQAKPLRTLPVKPRATLRFGVQVLVDTGEGMQLFASDQRDLVARIRSVAGAENVRLLYFSDVPSRGAGSGGRRTWRLYEPPSTGSRVLLISDFGIGGPRFHHRRSTTAEWRAFLAAVRRAGCSPIGLVPYPPSRWPAWLASSLPLLLWDRSTTVSRASVAVRRG
ncbi:hypothetical protein V1227_00795 [Lentzea sp. DG1S-22]|uniref:hypothetical protein n=1 Tax=Lentzea sp. DG1S-22 TaxID=3108822 RepID=UPI002E7A5C4D|nr:hypothetical protein [Lentzea sp. DG1S-22]WVH81322.1 hypothetical protein V1227_00795 [Lentzea sp. DG1S-22]